MTTAMQFAVGSVASAVLTLVCACTKAVAESPVDHAVPVASDAPAAKQAGIGVALRIEDGKVLVSKVLPETPAARSKSIQPNDEVVAIADGDGEPVDVVGTTDVARVVGMIRGPIGKVVRLTIVPAGKTAADAVVVSLIRGDIKQIDMFVDGSLLPLGSRAPNFKFAPLGNAAEGELSQFAGWVVVVEFWASWCGPCVRTLDELDSLEEQHPEWAGRVEILAVSVDEKKEDAMTLLDSKHWSHVTSMWAGPDVLKLYHVAGLPTMFVIDKDGSVAAVDHRLDIPAVIKPLLAEPEGEASQR